MNEVEELPVGLFDEMFSLLDRIEVEKNHTLASQRFAIYEKYGLTVEYGGQLSAVIN